MAISSDGLKPLIRTLTECARTSTGEPLDRTYPETRRRVLAALWRIERRAPDGLRLLLEGLRGSADCD